MLDLLKYMILIVEEIEKKNRLIKEWKDKIVKLEANNKLGEEVRRELMEKYKKGIREAYIEFEALQRIYKRNYYKLIELGKIYE